MSPPQGEAGPSPPGAGCKVACLDCDAPGSAAVAAGLDRAVGHEEIAEVVLFAASPAARCMQGAVLMVDGGSTA